MEMIPISQVTSKDQARQLAIDWQHWQADQALSYGELLEWHEYFLTLGAKFNLSKEFMENGI